MGRKNGNVRSRNVPRAAQSRRRVKGTQRAQFTSRPVRRPSTSPLGYRLEPTENPLEDWDQPTWG